MNLKNQQTTSSEKNLLSFLDLIDICDNVHIHHPSPLHTPFDSEKLVPFHLSEAPHSPAIGLLRPVIVEQLLLENERSRANSSRQLWTLRLDESSRQMVSFRDWLDTPSKRTAALKELCERWRDTELFVDVCGPKKWRNEMYPVYADPFGVHDYPDGTTDEMKLNYALEMERSACALFGIITYGVHMTIYDESEEDGQKTVRVWVPTRAQTKPTYVLSFIGEAPYTL